LFVRYTSLFSNLCLINIMPHSTQSQLKLKVSVLLMVDSKWVIYKYSEIHFTFHHVYNIGHEILTW